MNSSKAGLISYIIQMYKSLSAKKGKNLERVGAPNNKPQFAPTGTLGFSQCMNTMRDKQALERLWRSEAPSWKG
jgi:hypothetical protein